MIDAAQPVVLTRKDFASGQAARWCPGCGDHGILTAVQETFAGGGWLRRMVRKITRIGHG